jgi:hypothetical protein
MEEEPDPKRAFERFMQVDPRDHTNLDRLFDVTRQQFQRNEASGTGSKANFAARGCSGTPAKA